MRGRGVFSEWKRAKVANTGEGNEIEITAKKDVVLATGSSPIIPQVPELGEVDVRTPREATAANFVPEHLLILGGGVVGVARSRQVQWIIWLWKHCLLTT